MNKHWHITGAAGLLLVAMAGTAKAQTAPVKEQLEEIPSLEEIVVTARKREENLQETPISITALTGDALKEKNYTELADIAGATPNMQFSQGSNALVYIRGVGQGDAITTADPGVGIYVDGVYIARQTGTPSSLNNIERVEVLRGPQGTLFGKNTLGGAINILTKDPDGTFGGMGRATVGSRGRFDFDGTVQFPLSSTLSGSVSFSSQTQDGYYHNPLTGQDYGNTNRQSGRAKLRWQATDDLKFVLAADVEGHNQRNPIGNNLQAVTPITPNTTTLGDGTPVALIDPNQDPTAQALGLWNLAVGGCPPAANTASTCFGPQWLNDGYTTYETQAQRENGVNWGVGLTSTYDVNDITFKSITAYRKFWAKYDGGVDGTPMDIARIPTEDYEHQFSEELQASGTSFDDRLKWTAGLYYFKEHSLNLASVHFFNGVNSAFPLSAFDDGAGGIDVVGTTAVFGDIVVPSQIMLTSLNLNTSRLQVDTNYAAYGQGTFKFTEKLSGTLGLRYSYEKKEFTFAQTDLSDISVMGIDPTSLSKSWTSFTPKVGLEYQIDPDLLVYVSGSRGFKLGGFNARPTSNPPQFPAYDPEYMDTYEFGVKSELWDRRLRINGDVYYSKYRNMQLSTFIVTAAGYVTGVANAGDGTMKGAELEITALPLPRVDVSVGMGYLDFTYTHARNILGPGTDTKPGSLLPNIPRFNGNISMGVVLVKSDAGETKLRGDYRYVSKITTDLFNTPRSITGGYGVVDGRLSFASASKTWEAFVLGRNLTNKMYGAKSYFDLVGVSQMVVYEPPRQWGAGVQLNF